MPICPPNGDRIHPLARQIPSFATDATHRTIDLIKQYNAGVCQLILGAGAMQVSKLKSITAKHLCLAEQSVSFFAALLPRVQEMMCALIDGPKQILLARVRAHASRFKVAQERNSRQVGEHHERSRDFHLERLSAIVKHLQDKEGESRPESRFIEFARRSRKNWGHCDASSRNCCATRINAASWAECVLRQAR